MEICILATNGNYGSKLSGFTMKNASARRNLDFAVLQAEDQVQQSFGLDDEQWLALMGADYATTGMNELSNNELGKAIMRLIKTYLRDLARGGEATMLRNQKEAAYEGVADDDFGVAT